MIVVYLFRQSLFSLVVLCLLTVLVVGVTRLILAERARELAQRDTAEQVSGWHTQISGELPADQRQTWADLGHRAPEAMLRVCAFERPGKE